MNALIFRYWGKAGRENSDQKNEFHQLVYHCLDVAAVGAVLLERNSRLRRQLADAVDLPEKIFYSWALFFLAVHDLGKFSEAFQGLRHDLYEKLHGKNAEKAYSVRHDSLGYLVWKELVKKKGISKSNSLNYLPEIFFQGDLDTWVQAVMGHHGEPPNIVKGNSLLFVEHFCHTCSLPTEPQLWILEDITGAGKTEAALILAHRLMDQNQGDGVFIGLPTMATANAMYDRMGDSYRNLFDSAAAPSLILSHSARHLSEKFRQSILNEQKENLEYAHNEADASAQCNAWLANHQKKALLADVGMNRLC